MHPRNRPFSRFQYGPAAKCNFHRASLRSARPGRRSPRSREKFWCRGWRGGLCYGIANQQPIDDAVVLWFPGPASVTGEDLAEFRVHGGRGSGGVVRDARHSTIGAPSRASFIRRAFENGKLDLTEAEGLDDLIHADTDRQRHQALRQLKGLLGGRAVTGARRSLKPRALIEADIDFSDGSRVPAELIAPALARIQTLLGESSKCLRHRGEANACARVWSSRSPGRRTSASRRWMNQLTAARSGDRLAARWHHARHHRSAARSRRLSGDGDRHCRHSQHRRSGGAGRRAA